MDTEDVIELARKIVRVKGHTRITKDGPVRIDGYTRVVEGASRAGGPQVGANKGSFDYSRAFGSTEGDLGANTPYKPGNPVKEADARGAERQRAADAQGGSGKAATDFRNLSGKRFVDVQGPEKAKEWLNSAEADRIRSAGGRGGAGEAMDVSSKFREVEEELRRRGVSPEASAADVERRAGERAAADTEAGKVASENELRGLEVKFEASQDAERLVEEVGVAQAQKLKNYLSEKLERERKRGPYSQSDFARQSWERDIARQEQKIADLESSLIKRRNRT